MFFIHLTSLAMLAIAVSLDSFGVGMTYGLRKIKIPLLSVLIISCCSGIIIWLSMALGNVLTNYVSPTIARGIGASILIVIGSFAIVQHFRGSKQKANEQSENVSVLSKQQNNEEMPIRDTHSILMVSTATILQVELKRLGLVIQILKTPQVADVDRSGIISPSEAIMLGIALSLDAFGAGIGAALLGLPAATTALTIAICSALFLIGGRNLGQRFANVHMMKYFSYLPGILLIIFGVFKLF